MHVEVKNMNSELFGITLGSFWDRVGIILGSFWDRFGIVLGSFWDNVGIVLGSFLSAGARLPSTLLALAVQSISVSLLARAWGSRAD